MRSQIFVKSLLTIRDHARSLILLVCAVTVLIELPRLASYFRSLEQPRASQSIVLIEPAGAGMIKIEQSPATPAALPDDKKPALTPPAAAPAATAPEMANRPRDGRAALNLQAAQDLINGRIPAATVTPAGGGVQSEGYLPPWADSHAQVSAPSFASSSGAETPLAMPVAAQPVHTEMRRLSKRRSANAHRKAKAPSSPFGGLFGF